MVDLENLTPEILLALPYEEQKKIIEYIDSLRDYAKYNSIEFVKPFPYQQQFMKAGSEYKTRYLRAGNR
ncbi:TPA: hypothetical protein QH056_001833 [Klebsiella oxytoca]|nr:hypothetical protein [Klebsiella oxytoca]